MKNKSSRVRSRSRSSRKKEELKVVYISSPMKLKTSASRFRALVQELTGRDSDVSNSRFSHMVDGGCSEFVHEDHVSLREEDRIRESPASSESLLDHDVFGSSTMVDDKFGTMGLRRCNYKKKGKTYNQNLEAHDKAP
ncbi:hypothetical protein RJ640_015199 [Escallonia rubra]|uniref:VQ domain-containing protein n=1 Tax=Escallonia rubra TaxID=112253 RepID=A0AA88RA88_9ASTE|nr:hypothetical protein RJ640_015199 [Escallonia rubra]